MSQTATQKYPARTREEIDSTSIPPIIEPSRAGGASMNGMALLFTIVQRAATGAAGAAKRHPTNAVGARSAVAPPKADAKPNIFRVGGIQKKNGGVVRRGEKGGRGKRGKRGQEGQRL